MASDKSDLLYHYCSLSTFLTIVRNQTLRLSDVLKSNDSLERKYIIAELEDLIVNSLLESISNHTDTVQHSSESKRYYSMLIKKSLAEHIAFYDDSFTVSHVMCFSKDKDLLSQWRGYGDDGKGVAIGFSRMTLEKYFGNKQYIELADIQYGCPSFAFQKSLCDLIKRIYDQIQSYPGEIEGYISSTCHEIVCRLFLLDGLKYKKEAFREENEVRLMTKIPLESMGYLTQEYIGGFKDELQKEIMPFTLSYDFAARNNKITSYFDIHFGGKDIDPKITREFIKSIIIGPKANVSVQELSHVLRMTVGMDVNEAFIKKSDCSYR